MRRPLDDARAAGETVAALWASEGAIYGRFGFGPATRAMRYELQLDRVALRRRRRRSPTRRRRLARPGGRARADPRRVRRVRAARPRRACSTGAARWWERRIHDPEHRRDGAGPLRAAIQPGPDGEPAGYALFAANDELGRPWPGGQA